MIMPSFQNHSSSLVGSNPPLTQDLAIKRITKLSSYFCLWLLCLNILKNEVNFGECFINDTSAGQRPCSDLRMCFSVSSLHTSPIFTSLKDPLLPNPSRQFEHVLVITALQRWIQQNYKFKTSLDYIVSPRLGRTIQGHRLRDKHKTQVD